MSTTFRIETPSLVLRPLTLGDTRRMLEMSQEDCARQWLPSQVYPDERHAATVIEHLIGQFTLDASPTTNAFVFGVEEKPTGRLIGHVGLSPLFDTVEVGFGIATSEQRKGYATEGVARVCAWGLERFSLPAIVGVTDEENVASQRVLIRCGFSRKEEKMMRLQGVDRPAIIFEIRNKGPNQRAGESAAGLEPIGLAGYPGLRNVTRLGDPNADTLRQPADFYSPDTFNYNVLDVSADGKTLTVTSYGINSTVQNGFVEYDPVNNPERALFSFQIRRGPMDD